MPSQDTTGYRAGTPSWALKDLIDRVAALEEAGGGASTAEDVTYDNGDSGLEATDVQAAIDEVAAGAGGGGGAGAEDQTLTGTTTLAPADAAVSAELVLEANEAGDAGLDRIHLAQDDQANGLYVWYDNLTGETVTPYNPFLFLAAPNGGTASLLLGHWLSGHDGEPGHFDASNAGRVDWYADDGSGHRSLRVTLGGSGLTIRDDGLVALSGTLAVSGSITLHDLPTVDPAVADQLWNDAGTLKVSAGA